MAKIVPGRILYPLEALPDPQGQNPQKHPHLVISTQREIESGDDLWMVVITRVIKLEDDEFQLEWCRDGLGQTRLKKPSIAKACWHEYFEADSYEITKGFVKPTLVLDIRRRAEVCGSQPACPLQSPT